MATINKNENPNTVLGNVTDATAVHWKSRSSGRTRSRGRVLIEPEGTAELIPEVNENVAVRRARGGIHEHTLQKVYRRTIRAADIEVVMQTNELLSTEARSVRGGSGGVRAYVGRWAKRASGGDQFLIEFEIGTPPSNMEFFLVKREQFGLFRKDNIYQFVLYE